VPSLDLDFAGLKSLKDGISNQDLITHTRASSATFVDSSGVLRSAVTNLLLRSEEFQTTWTLSQLLAFGSGSVTDATTAPNGTLTADRITENTATAQRFINQGVSGIPASSVITVSCYVKFDSANRNFSLQITDAPSGGSGYAELYLTQGGVVTSPTPSSFTNRTATVENVGSGWYRVRLTITTAAVTTITTRLFIVSSANAQSYTGDGTSGLFLWGAQLEQSSTVGEYIPTTSTINSAPRFDHNPTTGESLGLLVEEARTNLLLNSATLSTQSVTVAAAANTLSFYGTGTITLTGTSTAGPLVGTGANNRVSLTFTPSAGSLTLTVSGSVTNAQLEAGAFATSYIPTTSATVTRAADVASITGSAFSSWYSQSEGTIYYDGTVSQGLAAFPWFYNITDGTINNSIGTYQHTSGIYGTLSTGGTAITPDPSVLFGPVSGAAAKHALAVKTSDTRAAYNGTLSTAQTNTVMPVVNQLAIGQRVTGNRMTGTIKRLVYWGQRLPNNVLQAITQ
jgi:hypothetical protein